MAKGKIFFLVIAGIVLLISAVGFWFWQKNVFSKDTVKIEILAVSAMQIGQEVDYLVKIKNNSDVLLENSGLVFEFPKNAVIDTENSTSTIQKLSDIYPGQELSFNYKCRVFGKENDNITANAWLTYKPKNLKAQFESRTSHTGKITTPNLTFEIDAPSKANQGEEVEISLNYFSNIDYILNNLHLKIDYPGAFEFMDAAPKALDTNEWNLPPLTQANGGRVKIRGRLNGQVGEQPMFKAQLGISLNNNFVILKEATAYLDLSEAEIYISQTVNGQQNYTAKAGELLRYEVFFKNIGQKALQNKFLTVKLQSALFDLQTVASDKGGVALGSDTIVFDWRNVQDLAFLPALSEGSVDFFVRVKDNAVSGAASVLKTNVSMGGIVRTFETKVSSALDFSQKVYFENDVFDNKGDLPLQAGTITQFTVAWYAKNGFNGLNSAKVKAVLPNNVVLTGKFIPETAGFTFDSVSRELVWQIGNLASNGQTSLAFQIEIMPQAAGSALLIRQAELSGADNFTGNILTVQAPAVYSSGVSLPGQ